MVDELVYLLLAGTLAAGVAQRGHHFWRDRGNPQLGMLLLSNVTGGLGLAALIPPVSARIDAWAGVPDVGGTAGRCLLMVCFVTAQLTYMMIVYPAPELRARVRPLLAGYAAAVAAMIVLLVAVRAAWPDLRFTLRDGARNPAVAAQLLIFYGGWAQDVTAVGRLSRRYARIADGPWLRRGLGVVAAGCRIGLAFPAHQSGLLAAMALGARPGDQDAVAFALIAACVLPVFAGLALPTAGPAVAGAAARVRRYRQYRGLYPLWRELYRAAPHIALEPPRRVDALTVRDLDFRLYRRVIEIRDGMLALRAGGGPDVPAEPDAASGPVARADLAAEVERLLRVARTHRRTRRSRAGRRVS